MGTELHGGEYRDVVLFLATAGVLVPLLRRWGISPILGFLLAGVVLGPSGLGALRPDVTWLRYLTIGNPLEMAQLAEFGVVFLLFTIGLGLSWERLWTMRRLVFGLGGLQVMICAAVISAGAAVLGLDAVPAFVTGVALALSSTAMVMPLLAQSKRQHSQAGRAIFSILLLQDLAVAPVLVTLTVLSVHRAESFSPTMLLAFAPAIGGLGAMVVLGRVVLRPMMRSVARAESEELFMAASLLVVIGAGLAATMAGISMALGAFIAGLLLAETEHRKQIERTVEPFKGLLLGVFFVSVGAGLDLSLLVANPVRVLGIMVITMTVNALVLFALSRVFRLGSLSSVETALMLAASGEFAFVVLQTAMQDNLLARNVGNTILVASILSMFCIPLLSSLATAIRRYALRTASAH
jgi:monovalent cation:H+ antiporter-2, CPA2 family